MTPNPAEVNFQTRFSKNQGRSYIGRSYTDRSVSYTYHKALPGVVMKKYMLLVFILFICLFIFPSDCVTGAKTGLLLWFNTMIPSVFPFILLTNIIREFNGIRYFNFIFGPFVKRFFHCSENGSYAVIVGFLCGYPMGAKAVCDSFSDGYIKKNEAQYLLGFCNNPSPMFVLNFVLAACLKRPELSIFFFAVVYISTWINAQLWYFFKYRRHIKSRPAVKAIENTLSVQTSASADGCIMSSLSLIQKIGGYMIIFAILCQLILKIPSENLPFAPGLLQSALSGFMEQTTGLAVLCGLPVLENIKIVLAAVFVCFGGFAIAAQTYGITCGQGLSIKYYILSKLSHAAIAGLLCAAYIFLPVCLNP